MNIVQIKDDSRVQSLNNRIYSRNIPSHRLQSQFDPRPQSTKYTHMPMIQTYSPITVPIRKEKPYKHHSQFNPGTRAPYDGYSTQIDNESTLHNMFMVNQKYANQSVYVPRSRSDLYNVYVPNDRPEMDPHQLLSKQEVWGSFNPDPYHIGTDQFRTHTRQRVKNISTYVSRVNLNYIQQPEDTQNKDTN